jgi:F-type H+-transporting ATPase subunit a
MRLMRAFRALCLCLLLVSIVGSTLAAESDSDHGAGATTEHSGAGAGAGAAHHELTQYALDVFHIGPLPITNSMIITWGVALGLILFAQLATRKMSLVPSGAQNFLEWMVESLHEFLEGVIGNELVKKTFWFFATIFIFILFTNWIGLFPGVGTIGWGTHGEHGFVVEQPLLRGGNADLNMTFAMSMIFFACWIYWALQANGFIGLILHLFGPQGDTTGFLKILMIFVFMAVGVLEVVSILFRPVSLSFRLYGNIFAGENMLETMANLVPGWLGSVLVPIPFYFMELLVGIVQALVFMLLTAVFTMLIAQHDEEAGHGKAQH